MEAEERSGFSPSEAYRDREIGFIGVRELDGWRLKLYAIRYGSAPLRAALYEPGLALAVGALPRPAVTAGRPGIGFVILHRGRGVHYLVLNWWVARRLEVEAIGTTPDRVRKLVSG